MLVLSGVAYQSHSAATALTATSLLALSLLAGSAATVDTLDVRAYNGSYWGDWTALGVTVVASAGAIALPPVLVSQTASQTWLGGRAVSLAVPIGTFSDPQGQALSYSATLANGQALPGWLTFNAAAGTFGGTAPTGAQTLSLAVTATDRSGLSAIDTFSVSIIGAPVVANGTANQTWTGGKAVLLALPASTFTDPQGQRLSYSATLANGQALPSWLTFNAATQTFSGTAPSTAQSLGIMVTATDSSGLSASESFTASVQPAAPAAKPVVWPGVNVTAQTPNQVWTDGQSVNLLLPSNTFTDGLGMKMTFAAYQVSGPTVAGWLHFNPATDDLYGVVPAAASGTVQIAVVASDSWFTPATDMFSVTLAPAAGHGVSAVQVPANVTATAFNPSHPVGAVALHS